MQTLKRAANMANDYLHKEYELCMEQIRYYDTRQESLLKYMLTLTSAVATAQFAIYQLLQGPTRGFFGCEAIVSGFVFIATVLLFLAMLQNRLYFVFFARQLNAIRAYLMKTESGEFHDNQLWTSTDVRALNPSSLHTYLLFGAALISSIFLGAFVVALRPALGCKPWIRIGVAVSLTVFLSELGLGAMYM